MTTEAKHVLEEFQALSDAAKREVLVEILRISDDLDYGELSDEELAFAANEVFLALDKEEETRSEVSRPE